MKKHIIRCVNVNPNLQMFSEYRALIDRKINVKESKEVFFKGKMAQS